MQDGYVFSDSVRANITMNEPFDQERYENAIQLANLDQVISNLNLKHETKIGLDGIGLSKGEIQRMLIARAVYRAPEYLFFDEVTSALDAKNEKIIMSNLEQYFKNKTVVVIAHRLSTVKNADQIIMMEGGRIVEIGNHNELREKRGTYFNFVRNQLEMST